MWKCNPTAPGTTGSANLIFTVLQCQAPFDVGLECPCSLVCIGMVGAVSAVYMRSVQLCITAGRVGNAAPNVLLNGM